jgi:hypothetical protein
VVVPGFDCVDAGFGQGAPTIGCGGTTGLGGGAGVETDAAGVVGDGATGVAFVPVVVPDFGGGDAGFGQGAPTIGCGGTTGFGGDSGMTDAAGVAGGAATTTLGGAGAGAVSLQVGAGSALGNVRVAKNASMGDGTLITCGFVGDARAAGAAATISRFDEPSSCGSPVRAS